LTAVYFVGAVFLGCATGLRYLAVALITDKTSLSCRRSTALIALERIGDKSAFQHLTRLAISLTEEVTNEIGDQRSRSP
jgi:hypothetical protein